MAIFLAGKAVCYRILAFSVMESCTSNANPPTFEFIENQWFEVGGWDIRKALRLQRKSNATLLEWLRSPIINTQDDDFTGRLNALAPQYVKLWGGVGLS